MDVFGIILIIGMVPLFDFSEEVVVYQIRKLGKGR